MKSVFAGIALLGCALVIFSANTTGPVAVSDGVVMTTENPLGGAFLIFAGKNGGDITKSELQGQTELKVDGCAKGSRIFTYSLEISTEGKARTLHAKSNMLTKDMITTLAGLDVGASFEFKSMKAYLPNGKDVVDVHGKKFVVTGKSST